ncbi:hypothetical protein BH23GEM9_BH23GEM9_26470 [soil metagenome]
MAENGNGRRPGIAETRTRADHANDGVACRLARARIDDMGVTGYAREWVAGYARDWIDDGTAA